MAAAAVVAAIPVIVATLPIAIKLVNQLMDMVKDEKNRELLSGLLNQIKGFTNDRKGVDNARKEILKVIPQLKISPLTLLKFFRNKNEEKNETTHTANGKNHKQKKDETKRIVQNSMPRSVMQAWRKMISL